MRTGSPNPHEQQLITTLKRESHSQQAPLWAAIAHDLERPSRQRRVVNLSRINRHTSNNETIIVPGKVLGSGNLDHSVTVAAWAFSTSAREHITKAKGQCLSILELLHKEPKGKNIKIIG